MCSGREESDGSLFRRWVLFFLSFANAGTGRILLPTPCNRRCRWIQEFCYHCMRGLVAQGSYILKRGIITSYPLSPTFYKAFVPANSSPKSSSGPQAQILCGCGLCVLAVIVISCPWGTAPTPAMHSSSLPAPRCRVHFLASRFPLTSSPFYLLKIPMSSPRI